MRSCERIARCPIDFMPLASGNTSAGRPVVLDTALLPHPFLPPAAKETRCDCLCPDGCAPHGNAANIAARLAAAMSLQVDEEKHIVSQQPLERQDFRREEVDPDQNVPV